MSNYLREQVQNYREENYEMQREIDTLVKTRDEAMDTVRRGTDAVNRAKTQIEQLIKQRDKARAKLEYAQNQAEY